MTKYPLFQKSNKSRVRRLIISSCLVGAIITSSAAPAMGASKYSVTNSKIAFTVGELTILSGPFAAGAKSHQNALTMAIRDLNKTNRFKISRATADCGSTPQSAVSAFIKIKQSRPLAVIGCPLSSQTNAIVAEVSKSQIIHLAPNALMVKDLGALAVNVFPPYAEYQVGPATVQFYTKFKSTIKTAYYIAGKDYAVGQGTVSIRKNYLEKRGVLTVGNDEVLSTDTNYQALAVKIASINPSVVIEDSLSSLVLLKQIRDAGYKGLIFGGAFVGNANFLTVQTGQFENAYSFAPWLARPASKLSATGRDFVARYKKEFGTEPDGFAAGIYDGMMILAESVSKAGGASAKPIRILKEMLKFKLIKSVSSSTTAMFDQSRVLAMSPTLIQVRNQQFVPVK